MNPCITIKTGLPEYTSIMCDSGLNFMGITNNFLIGFRTHPIKEKSCLKSLLGQEPMAKEVIGPRGELTTVVLLSICSIKLTS